MPDYSTVFCLVARFLETCSGSDRKASGRHTALNDVSVEDILHLLVLYSRKSLTLRLLMSYIYIYMEHLFLMFLDHTQRRSTVGRTPLDE